MLANQRGTSLVMYAALVGVVLALAVAMKLTVQQAVQAKIASATVDMLRLPTGTGKGYDAGDGHGTQIFGGTASENLQGFLDDPRVIATANVTRSVTSNESFSGGTYTSDESSTASNVGTSVSRELLPNMSTTAPPGGPSGVPTVPTEHGPHPREYVQ